MIFNPMIEDKEYTAYNKETIEIIEYIFYYLDEISLECEEIGIGEAIRDEFLRIRGFNININNIVRVLLQRDSDKWFFYTDFYYKELLVLKAELHTEGYILMDAYERKDTKHDLQKGFRYFLDYIRTEFYEHHLKKVEEQNLHRDKMYEEYLEKISDTSSIFG